MLTVLLYYQKKICIFSGMDRLNKYGLCVTSSRKYVVFDDIGKHFLDHAVELVKAGMKFVYVISIQHRLGGKGA